MTSDEGSAATRRAPDGQARELRGRVGTLAVLLYGWAPSEPLGLESCEGVFAHSERSWESKLEAALPLGGARKKEAWELCLARLSEDLTLRPRSRLAPPQCAQESVLQNSRRRSESWIDAKQLREEATQQDRISAGLTFLHCQQFRVILENKLNME